MPRNARPAAATTRPKRDRCFGQTTAISGSFGDRPVAICLGRLARSTHGKRSPSTAIRADRAPDGAAEYVCRREAVRDHWRLQRNSPQSERGSDRTTARTGSLASRVTHRGAGRLQPACVAPVWTPDRRWYHVAMGARTGPRADHRRRDRWWTPLATLSATRAAYLFIPATAWSPTRYRAEI
jgi:hypothetical protein